MIILIAGASHTGKTVLAQRLLEKYHYPYLSIDHLKMGLIRSGYTLLTPMSPDGELTAYLWPIVREMIRTALENGQNLIVEGCYIPYNWQEDFSNAERAQIRAVWLIFSRGYIERNFAQIKAKANAVEQRLDDSGLCMQELIEQNEAALQACKTHGCPYRLIDEEYRVEFAL